MLAAVFTYRYELWRGDEVTATGHLSGEEELQVGDRVVTGNRPGMARSVDAQLGESEGRLTVQLMREGGD